MILTPTDIVCLFVPVSALMLAFFHAMDEKARGRDREREEID